jgi:hypothetical protein
MSKAARYLVYFLIFDAVIAGAYFLLKSSGRGGRSSAAEYPWVTIDAAYVPKNAVEEFIKSDAEVRGALPVEIRNYGRDAKILAMFKGRQFAKPKENVLAMFFKSLDDWMLVDLRYKTENEREALRTVLYIFAEKQWRVGDTGILLK